MGVYICYWWSHLRNGTKTNERNVNVWSARESQPMDKHTRPKEADTWRLFSNSSNTEIRRYENEWLRRGRLRDENRPLTDNCNPSHDRSRSRRCWGVLLTQCSAGGWIVRCFTARVNRFGGAPACGRWTRYSWRSYAIDTKIHRTRNSLHWHQTPLVVVCRVDETEWNVILTRPPRRVWGHAGCQNKVVLS